jgi:hypothetical protein
VFLTTATTVMGLAPLLYERSSQAEFLRPTVITLVYGLGFGFVLVLVLVPAILAIQADIGRQFHALQRGMRWNRHGTSAAARRSRAVLTGAAVVLAVWFALTLGWVLVTGSLFAPLAGLLQMGPMAAAFMLFMAGVVGVVLLAYALGLLLFRMRKTPQSG